MKGCVLNCSKSSMCSPVPMKIMGDLVAATADSAPPPFACPSNLVTITDATSTFSVKIEGSVSDVIIFESACTDSLQESATVHILSG